MKQSNLSKVFKALSSEQRLNIFLMIYHHCGHLDDAGTGEKIECSCMEKAFTTISRTITLSRSTISHHLKELQNANLIHCERNGQSFNCRVNKELLNEIRALFD